MKKEYDETFTNKEIKLIDDIIEKALKTNDLKSEEELKKILGY